MRSLPLLLMLSLAALAAAEPKRGNKRGGGPGGARAGFSHCM